MNRFIIGVLSVLLFTSQLYAERPLPIFESNWKPSDSIALATYAGDPITEEEYFLWLMLEDRDPLILETWRQAAEDDVLRENLRRGIREMIEDQLIAKTAPASIEDDYDLSVDKAARILAARPTAMSYADLLVKNSVKVSPYDISLYYQRNQQRFSSERDGTVQPIGQVRDEIYNELFPDFYRQQYELQVRELIERTLPVNRARFIALLEPEVQILRVGEFELTRDEFFVLYPELAPEPRTKRTSQRIIDNVGTIVRYEAILQELSRQSLLSGSYYGNSYALAKSKVASDRVLESQLSQSITPEELEAYAERNREELAPSLDYTVWRLTSPERDGDGVYLGSVQRRQATGTEMINQATQLLNERAELSGIQGYAIPELVVQRLVRENPLYSKFKFENIGAFTSPQTQNDLGFRTSDVPIGSFTRLRESRDGALVAYYIAGSRDRPMISKDELLRRAEKKYREETLARGVRETIRQAESQGRLNWSAPLK